MSQASDTNGQHSQDIWQEILSILAQRISPHSVDVWFRPVVFAGCNEDICQISVPNEAFRASLVENYSDILQSAIVEVLGTPRKLSVSVEQQDAPCSGLPLLPVVQASNLKMSDPADQWLIENLWLMEGVGIIGGPPRAYKSWLALDMAVSVASGSPCLGVFPVRCSGPVLIYAAEDSESSLRSRLESLARNRQIDFSHLDVRVITSDLLRLDLPDDQRRLEATIALHQPKLLIIDPLVRIHGADENASGPMAALLGYFRALQRKNAVSIILIHHSGKRISTRAGYSLRGSSDFYAWTDCLLSLECRHEQHRLSVEHRSAPGSGPFTIELVTPLSPELGPHLTLCRDDETDAPQSHDSLNERILQLLSKSTEPLSAETIRMSFRTRKQRLLETLRDLVANGRIVKLPGGYALKSTNA
jgi:hypothetical protein